MLCYAVVYTTAQWWRVVLWYGVACVVWCAVLFCVVLCRGAHHRTVVVWCMVWRGVLWCGAWRHAVLYAALRFAALCCIVPWCGVVWFGLVLFDLV